MLGPKIKSTVHGWLILDKPLGLTSTQAIGKARRFLAGKKVGHGGTLDPLATGILPLAFGEATKLIPYVMDGDKVYEFTIRWGEQRSTDDAEGEVTKTSNKRPSEADILKALPDFVGNIQQTPPAFSAIKLDGERAYDIARAGGKPEMASREVVIHALDYLSSPDKEHSKFRVSCGKGMYVRSLARDLALKLGTVGFVSALRRTAVGAFTLDKAVALHKLEEMHKAKLANDALLPLDAILGDMPKLVLNASEAQRLRAGQAIVIRPNQTDFMEMPIVFTVFEDVPVALVEPKAGEFRVIRGFHF